MDYESMVELISTMKEKHFTDNGIALYLEVKNEYADIVKYYDEYMGNFGFTEAEMIYHLPTIKKWLTNHINYALIYADYSEDDIDACWFLSEVEE